MVAGLGQSDFQPPSSGPWTLPRPPPEDGSGPNKEADLVEAVNGGPTTVGPPGERPDRLQLTTFRPSLDVAHLVATLREEEAREEQEEEDEEREEVVRVKENQLQALLHQLDSSEFREPANGQPAWDISAEAKKFRAQQKVCESICWKLFMSAMISELLLK